MERVAKLLQNRQSNQVRSKVYAAESAPSAQKEGLQSSEEILEREEDLKVDNTQIETETCHFVSSWCLCRVEAH